MSELFDLAMDIRTSLNQIIGENDQKQVWVEIFCNQKNYKMLQVSLNISLKNNVEDLFSVRFYIPMIVTPNCVISSKYLESPSNAGIKLYLPRIHMESLIVSLVSPLESLKLRRCSVLGVDGFCVLKELFSVRDVRTSSKWLQ